MTLASPRTNPHNSPPGANLPAPTARRGDKGALSSPSRNSVKMTSPTSNTPSQSKARVTAVSGPALTPVFGAGPISPSSCADCNHGEGERQSIPEEGAVCEPSDHSHPHKGKDAHETAELTHDDERKPRPVPGSVVGRVPALEELPHEKIVFGRCVFGSRRSGTCRRGSVVARAQHRHCR